MVAELPLFTGREELSARLSAAGASVKRGKSLYVVSKKPAGCVTKRPAAKPCVEAKTSTAMKTLAKRLRRTPFQLKRSSLK